MSDEALREAVRTTVAREVLAGLDESHREAYLVKAITNALGDYSLTSAVSGVVAEKARRVAAELCETEEWERRIRETIQRGFEDYLDSLQRAIPETLKKALHGCKDGSYSTMGGAVLGHWPRGNT